MNAVSGPELAIILVFVFLSLVLGTAIQAVVAWLISSSLRRLPPEHQQVRPDYAWFLVIPVFNVFWNFYVCTKAPQSFKSFYDSRRRADVGDCGRGLGLAYSICTLASAVPFLGCLSGPASLVLLILFLVRIHELGRQAEAATAGAPTQATPASARGAPVALIIVAVAAGLIAVVSVVAILATVAIPNLMRATEKAKQSRAMSDLMALGAAIETYSADVGSYPAATEISELMDALAPNYSQTLPAKDPWGNLYQVRSTSGAYLVFSMGRDGVAGGCDAGVASSPDADICYADGNFTQEPDWVP